MHTVTNRSTLRWIACVAVAALGLALVLLAPPAPGDDAAQHNQVAAAH